MSWWQFALLGAILALTQLFRQDDLPGDEPRRTLKRVLSYRPGRGRFRKRARKLVSRLKK